MQITMDMMLKPTYKITKPIRLIELFAGYGSQALALKYLGVKFEHWRICEWAVKSIQAYRDVHFTNQSVDVNLGKDELVKYLYGKGISMDYNSPMLLEQIRKMPIEKLKDIYSNIQVTHNLVNIQQVKAMDLNIKDTNEYTYIVSYSFPCQDLSLMGKCKGMSDTSTRSGMLWEVERILDECKELNTMPEILIMENVPQVHGSNSINDFIKWIKKLESLGYSNYYKDINSLDYGVPQSRERTFMVSILGDYNYNFPEPVKLEKRLGDILEKNVAEKYYLSEQMLRGMQSTDFESYKLENKLLDRNGVASTIIARFDGSPQCVQDYGEYECIGTYRYSPSNKVCPTQQDRISYGDNGGYSGTLITSGNQPGVILKSSKTLKKELCDSLIERGVVQEFDVIRHSYSKNKMDKAYAPREEKNNISPTLDTRCDCLGVVVSSKDAMRYEDVMSLRIRKLTPLECGLLMGVKEEDINNMKKNQGDAGLYHLFGDSIVTNCLMGIFKELLGGTDYEESI